MFAWSWGLLALLWIFEKLLLLLAVLALALMCRKLLLGGRALAAGDLSYQVDTSRMVLDFKSHGEDLNHIAQGMAAAVEELLPALSVLLGIWLVKKVVEALLRGEAVMHLTLTLGEAISMGVLLAASVGIVTYLCRTALEGERGRSRGKGFFMAWAFCVALLAAIFLPTFLLTNPLLTLWLPVAVAVVILPLLVHGVLARWMER